MGFAQRPGYTFGAAARGLSFNVGSNLLLNLKVPDANKLVGLAPDTRDLLVDYFGATGGALEPLRSEGVLIVGSGMSYHNMRGFGSGDPRVADTAKKFDDWLNAAVTDPDPEARNRKLIAWEKAPGGLESHPRSEHLITLFVAAGAAGADRGQVNYNDQVMGVAVSGHIFGEGL